MKATADQPLFFPTQTRPSDSATAAPDQSRDFSTSVKTPSMYMRITQAKPATRLRVKVDHTKQTWDGRRSLAKDLQPGSSSGRSPAAFHTHLTPRTVKLYSYMLHNSCEK